MPVKVVETKLIRENPVALRAVDRNSEAYLGLVDSMREKGFFGAITARKRKDPDTEEVFYELVDGLHRLAAARDAGIEAINTDIVNYNDDAVLEAQIMANIHKIETRPVDYSKQLLRILGRNPLWTESQLATKLGKSTMWIQQRLGLNKISNPKIAGLVNEGKINLSNAYALAKLPEEEMPDFVDRAMTLPPDEFIPSVNSRVKEIRTARRKGVDPKDKVFEPVAFMQKMAEVKAELNKPAIGPELVKVCGAETPEAGFHLAVQWCLHLDPESVKIQKAKDEERKAQKKAAADKRKAEREAKKAEEAKRKAEEAAKESVDSAAVA